MLRLGIILRTRISILVTAVCVPAAGQISGAGTSIPKQVFVQEIVISGTTTLDTAKLHEITNDLTARRMGENDKEIRQRIRDAFQQRGYFDAQVTNLNIRPLDVLARPKPVRIEAEVSEGVRFKVGDIRFEGNRAVGTEQLSQLFLLRSGICSKQRKSVLD